MIVGLGLDVVEVDRVSLAIATHGDRFLERILTDRERADCGDRKDRDQAIAARFAAKEAGMKALGTGWGDGVGFHDFEVVRGEGPPGLRLQGEAAERAARLGVTRVVLSLTHERRIAAAVVVMEGDGVKSPSVR